jgi:GTP-binding protein Era
MQDSDRRPPRPAQGESPKGDRPEGRPEHGAPEHRSGFVAICGRPNAGKSTLLNALVGERLAITTRKPQTTRRRTLGILSAEDAQIVFLDTPGILEPRYELQGAMMRQVEQSIADADLLLYVLDARRPQLAPGIVVAAREKPLLIAINKADLLPRREEALPLIDRLRGEVPAAEFFVISALKGTGLAPLRAALRERLPLGPPFYPPEQLTEHPERFFVSELVREAVFERYRQEIPYSTEVTIEEFREREGHKDFIAATIHVEAESQKGILIGRGGRAVRSLGEQARRAIEAFLGRPVYLELRVKVLPNWRKDARALRRFGY